METLLEQHRHELMPRHLLLEEGKTLTRFVVLMPDNSMRSSFQTEVYLNQ